MGRIRTNVTIAGKSYWALFDSGSRNNYIRQDVAKNLPVFELEESQHISLGGKVHRVVKDCRISCLIEGLPVIGIARVLEEIGMDEDGKEIEILIGALTMQEWGIKLDLEGEKLDMTHYPKEFVEF